MLRYIYLISILLFAFLAVSAQNKEEWTPAQGFTLGANLATPINSFFNNERKGFSLLSRVTFKENLYIFGEAGFENISFEREKYDYNANGSFFKVGMEWDLLKMKKKEFGKNDNLLTGIYYGYAFQEQGAPKYLIPNGYWNDYSGKFGNYFVQSHWFEVSLGPRAEIFTNFFLSWSLHIKFTVFRKNPNIIDPYIIPGYGNGNNNVNASFSYNIEYLIPWKKATYK